MIDWKPRDENKLMAGAVVFMIVTLLAVVVWAGGLRASFSGSRFTCPDDPSVVFCSEGVEDHSNNLLDLGGSNLLTDRTEFDDWTEGGTCVVTADQYRNPVDGTLDADYLDNTGDAAGRRYKSIGAPIAGEVTGSVWIRADYNHVCTV